MTTIHFVALCSVALLMTAGPEVRAAELNWIEPFDAAKEEAKKTGKPMLVFIGESGTLHNKANEMHATAFFVVTQRAKMLMKFCEFKSL